MRLLLDLLCKGVFLHGLSPHRAHMRLMLDLMCRAACMGPTPNPHELMSASCRPHVELMLDLMLDPALAARVFHREGKGGNTPKRTCWIPCWEPVCFTRGWGGETPPNRTLWFRDMLMLSSCEPLLAHVELMLDLLLHCLLLGPTRTHMRLLLALLCKGVFLHEHLPRTHELI